MVQYTKKYGQSVRDCPRVGGNMKLYCLVSGDTRTRTETPLNRMDALAGR